MSRARNLAIPALRLCLLALTIAALSVAAGALREHIERQALAAIEAEEAASRAGEATLSLHVEIDPAVDVVRTSRRQAPPRATYFTIGPAPQSSSPGPSRVKKSRRPSSQLEI